MRILETKCDLCGAQIHFAKDQMVVRCIYCQKKQVRPQSEGPDIADLERANELWAHCEFEEAARQYQAIIAHNPKEYEALWKLMLCKYGVQYVFEEQTGKQLIICHIAQKSALRNQPDYMRAYELAPEEVKAHYLSESTYIDNAQAEIRRLRETNERDCEIFLCFKDKDDRTGLRTDDSVYAEAVYHRLTELGYSVFYSNISLASAAGEDYEAAIYRAIETAKVMLAIGTKKEYYESTWVKSEWTRFLKRLEEMDVDKLLIPLYRADPLSMPQEWIHLKLQGIDLTTDYLTQLETRLDIRLRKTQREKLKMRELLDQKAMAEQETMRMQEENQRLQEMLARLQENQSQPGDSSRTSDQKASANANDVTRWVKKGNIALSDYRWKEAGEAFSQALELDPECAEAYLGEYLSRNRAPSLEELDGALAFFGDLAWRHAMEFADEQLKQRVADLSSKWEQDWARCAERVAAARKKTEKARDMIAANEAGYIALKSDGTVVCMLKNGQELFPGWSRVISVAAGDTKSLGSVFAGVLQDGTVVAIASGILSAAPVLDHEINRWTDIVRVKIGNNHIVALTKDHTLVATGNNDHGQCNVQQWDHIISFGAGESYTVALREDGTMLLAGDPAGKEDIFTWKDVRAVIALKEEIVGLDQYGRVLSTGPNPWVDEFESTREVIDITNSGVGRHYLYADGKVEYLGFDEHKGDPKCQMHGMVAFAEDPWVMGSFGIGIDQVGWLVALIQMTDDGTQEKTISDKEDRHHLTLFSSLDNLESEFANKEKWQQDQDWEEAFEHNQTLRTFLACNRYAIAAVISDGTLFMLDLREFGYEKYTKYWSRLVAVAMDKKRVIGLRDDGSVYAVNVYGDEQKDITENWHDIVQIVAGDDHIAALRSDGHVYVSSTKMDDKHDLSAWENVKHLYAGADYTIGLCEDGSVLSTGNNERINEFVRTTDCHDVLTILTGEYGIKYVTTDHRIIQNSLDPVDVLNAVQFETAFSHSACLYANGYLYYDGQQVLNTEKYHSSTFYAYALDSLTFAKGGVAVTHAGELFVFGIELTDQQKEKLKECYLFKSFDVDKLQKDRNNLFDHAEKKRNLYHALAVKEAAETARAREELIKAINQEESHCFNLEQEHSFLQSSPLRMLRKKEIARLEQSIAASKARIEKMEKTDPATTRWCGPFPFDGSRSEYEHECQRCSTMINLVCTGLDQYGPVLLCDDCLIKADVHCVVCGEFDLQWDSQGIRTRVGNYICYGCLQHKQDQEAIVGSVLGQCDACSKKNTPLWLKGKMLLCEQCKL